MRYRSGSRRLGETGLIMRACPRRRGRRQDLPSAGDARWETSPEVWRKLLAERKKSPLTRSPPRGRDGLRIARFVARRIDRDGRCQVRKLRKLQVRCKVQFGAQVEMRWCRDVERVEGMRYLPSFRWRNAGRCEVLKRLRGAATRLGMIAQKSPAERHSPHQAKRRG